MCKSISRSHLSLTPILRSTVSAAPPPRPRASAFWRAPAPARHATRPFSSAARLPSPVTFAPPSTSYQSVSQCPDPTCPCAATPTLSEPIDYTTNIRESAPAVAQHIVVCTGQNDWSSRIEDTSEDDGTGREVRLVKALKARSGRKWRFFNPMRPVLITNSSFRPSSSESSAEQGAAAYLFPLGLRVADIPDTPEGLAAFTQEFLSDKAESPSARPSFRTERVTVPTILICSHGTRDARCGALGPVLHAEFGRQLQRVGIAVGDGARDAPDHPPAAGELPALQAGSAAAPSRPAPPPWPAAHVGMVSHIGGHKWAGNVIVYFPPAAAGALAGKGVWYGRVEPRHVEGIVRETVLGGRVIEELCRGVR